MNHDDNYGDYILSLLNKTRFVKNWCENKYKEKSIIIYGAAGLGKSMLSDYILKDFIIIKIDIESCKKITSLNDFLKLSLYKKSITMMFDKNTRIKALVFDDLKYIQQNDKNLFKQIIDFSKKKCDFPVIYICEDISHKSFKNIYNISYPIYISFKKSQIKCILNKYFSVKNVDLDELINKSLCNFHSMKLNLEFHENNTKNIEVFDKKNDHFFDILQSIFKESLIDNYYRLSSTDYLIISFNILENCIDWIYHSKISEKRKKKLIYSIYQSISIGDNLYNNLYSLYDWDIINHVITHMVVVPIKLLLKNKIKITSIDYNRYVSRSIIYTYNTKILNANNINVYILSVIYTFAKNKDYENLKKVLSEYSVDQKIFEKFLKYFDKYFVIQFKNNTLKKIFKK